MTELGNVAGAVDGAVAAILATPGWETAAVTLPGSAADLSATVFVTWREQPQGGIQRRGCRVLMPIGDVPEQPRDGTLVTLADSGTVITIRTALEAQRFWVCEGWA